MFLVNNINQSKEVKLTIKTGMQWHRDLWTHTQRPEETRATGKSSTLSVRLLPLLYSMIPSRILHDVCPWTWKVSHSLLEFIYRDHKKIVKICIVLSSTKPSVLCGNGQGEHWRAQKSSSRFWSLAPVVKYDEIRDEASLEDFQG